MSAVLDISDRELQNLESLCASAIVLRIEAGHWDDFWSERACDMDLHCDVQEAFREMSGNRGRPDPDVAFGVLRRAVGKAAEAYAKEYVEQCEDVQELAHTLGVAE